MGNYQTTAGQSEADIRRGHITAMDERMKKRFQMPRKRHSLRIAIVGDSNTGKTSLFERLRGGKFNPEYVTTTQLQAAHILWNPKHSLAVGVDVEVWDVADINPSRERKSSDDSRKTIDGLKRSDFYLPSELPTSLPMTSPTTVVKGANQVSPATMSTINVFRGTHAFVIMTDPFKKWTFKYAEDVLGRIPAGCTVCLVANFKDVPEIEGRKRSTSFSEYQQLVGKYKSSLHIQAIECSMANCFGLKILYEFINLPFLNMEIQRLRMELKSIESRFNDANTEVNQMIVSENYDRYLEYLKDRSKGYYAAPPSVVSNCGVMASSSATLSTNNSSNSIGAPSPLALSDSISSIDVITTEKEKSKKKKKEKLSKKEKKLRKKKSRDGSDDDDNSSSSDDATQHSSNKKNANKNNVVGVIVSKSGSALDDFYAGEIDDGFLDSASEVSESVSRKQTTDFDEDVNGNHAL